MLLSVIGYLSTLVKSLSQMEIDDAPATPKYTVSESGASKYQNLHFHKDVARPASTPPHIAIPSVVSVFVSFLSYL